MRIKRHITTFATLSIRNKYKRMQLAKLATGNWQLHLNTAAGLVGAHRPIGGGDVKQLSDIRLDATGRLCQSVQFT